MRNLIPSAAAASAACLLLASSALAVPGVPDSNGVVTLGMLFTPANGASFVRGMSADGRFVVYHSFATNITVGDTNNHWDMYRYDRTLGVALLISATPLYGAGNGESVGMTQGHMITNDGRYVLFTSAASDLVLSDTNDRYDAFLRDTNGAGSTIRVSLGSGGVQLTQDARALAMSDDTRKILFYTKQSLVAGDTNVVEDVYVYDRFAQSIALVSHDANGRAVGSDDASISNNGRFMAFEAWGAALPLDTNGYSDVYVWDTNPPSGTNPLQLASIRLASGPISNGGSGSPDISGDGSAVAFLSGASNLVLSDTNADTDVFVKRLTDGTMVRASTTSTGAQVSAPVCLGGAGRVSLSANGRIVAMTCAGPGLVPNDTNNFADIFTKDLNTNTTTLISRRQGGALGNGHSVGGVLNADGSLVGFHSSATNLTSATDSNGADDGFVGSRL